MHDDAVTGRCELLLFKDFLQLTMNVYIYIYIFLAGSKFLQTAVCKLTSLNIVVEQEIGNPHLWLVKESPVYINATSEQPVLLNRSIILYVPAV